MPPVAPPCVRKDAPLRVLPSARSTTSTGDFTPGSPTPHSGRTVFRPWLIESLTAAATNSHQLCGLNDTHSFPYSSGGQSAQGRGVRASLLPEALEEDRLLPCLASGGSCLPWWGPFLLSLQPLAPSHLLTLPSAPGLPLTGTLGVCLGPTRMTPSQGP